jgi:hypothetical protein
VNQWLLLNSTLDFFSGAEGTAHVQWALLMGPRIFHGTRLVASWPPPLYLLILWNGAIHGISTLGRRKRPNHTSHSPKWRLCPFLGSYLLFSIQFNAYLLQEACLAIQGLPPSFSWHSWAILLFFFYLEYIALYFQVDLISLKCGLPSPPY